MNQGICLTMPLRIVRGYRKDCVGTRTSVQEIRIWGTWVKAGIKETGVG